MIARAIDQLPGDDESDRFSFEPKMDGFLN
jgi:hypothetical protein